jgi:hypothetical protein
MRRRSQRKFSTWTNTGYERPYLNPDGEIVRWHFERVVDVYDTFEESLSGESVEVFSSLRRRRMRPEFVWQGGVRR